MISFILQMRKVPGFPSIPDGTGLTPSKPMIKLGHETHICFQPSALFFTACNIDHRQMREWGQLWGKEGVAALDYGVLGAIDPRGRRVLGKGLTPETKLLVL